LRAHVQLNSAELNIIKVKDGLTLAKLSLAEIIGLIDTTSYSISGSVTGTFQQANEGFSDAVNNRPEITLLSKLVDQQNLQVSILRSDYIPTIGFSANGVTAIGKKGINPSDISSNFLGSYYGLLNINIPIWDWGATRQKIRAQMFKVSAQQIQLDETKQLIAIEVKQAYLQLNESVKRIEFSNTSVAQAEENLRLSNDRFKAGTILSKDVLEAQNIWEQANSDLIDAKMEYKIDEAQLQKAMGILK
jgi:outer membrane protein